MADKKLVPTVAVTIVRDGKRITRGPKDGAFAFTADEVKSIRAVLPTAFRAPVNEDPLPTDATAPDGNAGATATDDPKPSAKKKAAQKDSTSKAATKEDGETAPKSTDAAPKADDGEDDDI